MQYFYSVSTNGFYVDDVHSPAQIPQDAKPISTEVYKELFRAHSEDGKEIHPGADGTPELRDPSGPTSEEHLGNKRNERNNALIASDQIIVRCYESSTAVPAEWVAYRQALRDLPSVQGFPNVDLPTLPTI
jgi:hypothetical protein